ncbi:MAG: AsmA family protein [Planctomycetes bacterium]|nr:AsmA family protein [Planctomycetota bacterium]
MQRLNLKRFARDLLLLAFLGALHLYLLASLFLSPVRLRQAIESELSRRLGQPFDIAGQRLVFPDTLELHGVRSALAVQPEAPPWLQVSSIRFQVDPLQLLRGRVEVRRIEVSQPRLILDLSPQPDAAGSRGASPDLWGGASPGGSRLLLDDIDIADASVTLLRLPGFGPDERVELADLSARISRIRGLHQGFRITGDLSTQGLPRCAYRLDIDESTHTLRGDIHAEDAEISEDLFHYLPLAVRELCKPYRPRGKFDLAFGFRFNWQSRTAETLTLRVDLRGCSATIPAFPHPVENLSGHIQTDGKNLLVREVAARLGTAEVELSGHRILSGQETEENWNIGLRGLALDQDLETSLTAATRKLWKDVEPSGHLQARLKLTREGASPFRIVADFQSDDLRIVYRQFPYPAQASGGHIEWDGVTCLFRNIQVRAGPTSAVVNGEVEPAATGQKHLHVRVSHGVLDDRFRAALPPRTRGVWDKIAPSGIADGEYEYFRDREGQQKYRVRFVGLEAAARYAFFPLPVRLLSGTATWTQDSATLQDVRAAFGPTTFKIDGEFHPNRPRPGDRITVAAENLKLDAALRAALQPGIVTLWDDLQPEGKVQAILDLHGSKEGAWRYTLNLSSDNARIGYRPFPYPVQLSECTVEWDAASARLLNFRCKAEGASFGVHGEIARGSADVASSVLRFDFQKLDLDNRLRQALPKDAAAVFSQFQLQGQVDGSLEVQFERQEPPRFDLQGRTENASATYRRFPVPVRTDRFHLAWDAQGLKLRALTGRIGDAPVSLQASLPHTPGQQAQIDIAAQDLLIQPALVDALPEPARRIARQFHLDGVTDLEARLAWQTGTQSELRYAVTLGCKDLSACYDLFPAPLAHLSGKFTVTQDSLTLPKLEASLRGSPVTIEGATSWASGQPQPDLAFEVRDLPLDSHLYQLLPPDYQELWKDLAPSGRIRKIRYQLRAGDAGRLAHTFQSEIAEANMTYRSFPVPLTDLTAAVSFDNQQVRVENLKAGALGGNVQASGTFGNGTADLDIAAEGLSFNDDLFQHLPAVVQEFWKSMSPTGDLDVSTHVHSVWDPVESRTDFQSVISLKNVEAAVGFLLREVSGVMRLKGLVRGDVLENLDGSATLEQLQIRGETLRDITATLVKEGDRMLIQELRASYHGGLLRADFDQDRPQALTTARLSFSNVNVGDFASRFGSQSRLSGLARGDMQISVRGADVQTLDGGGRLFVDGGELWDLPTLDLLYGILKVDRKNRVRQMEMQFGLDGPAIQVQTLKLVGDEYNIYGCGRITLDWVLDLTLFVAKSSMLKDVVKAIPAGPLTHIFKVFLERFEASLYQVEVRGPIDSAKPESVPFKHSVPEKLLEEMLKDGKKT